MKLRPVFSVEITNVLPKAVAFGEYVNNEQEILVFGLYDGKMWADFHYSSCKF